MNYGATMDRLLPRGSDGWSEERLRRARMVLQLVPVCAGITGGLALVRYFVTDSVPHALTLVMGCGLSLAAAALVRRDRVLTAGHVLTLAVWLTNAMNNVWNGSLLPAALAGALIIPVMAALVVGARAGLIWGFASAVQVSVSAAFFRYGWGTVPDLTFDQLLANAQGTVPLVILGMTAVSVVFERHRSRAMANMTSARESALEASRAKSEFLANMSHEIRTPLTSVLGYAELLANQELGEADSRRALQTILRNGKHLSRIIDDILDLAKVEASELSIVTERGDIRTVVTDVVALMGGRAKQKGIELSSGVDSEVPAEVCTDFGRVRQVLINIVGNALKFTHRGEVSIAVQARETDAGTRVRVDVRDSGIGMSPEVSRRIFDAFAQADSSVSKSYGGTGLGLTLSRQLAQMLGGDLELVASEVGRGSHFRFEVLDQRQESAPAAAPTTASSAPASAAGAAASTARVLLAEDSPDNQHLIGFFLRKAGATVDIVDNGKSAHDQALEMDSRGQPYDLVLMDVQMPIMDGYAATRLLRATGYRRPIIALTANAMETDRDRAFDAGVDDFAEKPIDRSRLLELLQRYESAGPKSPG